VTGTSNPIFAAITAFSWIRYYTRFCWAFMTGRNSLPLATVTAFTIFNDNASLRWAFKTGITGIFINSAVNTRHIRVLEVRYVLF